MQSIAYRRHPRARCNPMAPTSSGAYVGPAGPTTLTRRPAARPRWAGSDIRRPNDADAKSKYHP